MNWYPHVTVATTVERNGLFLMVEERKNGKLLLNQPAGHLEKNETLFEAALRETREETQWQVRLTGLLGNALFTSPVNGVTYYRTSFVAEALEQDLSQPLDSDIERAIWLSAEEIQHNKARLRSPMIIHDIARYQQKQIYPLELVSHPRAEA